MAEKGVRGVAARNEGVELITNKDLVLAANELLGGITLDVASSRVANEYVEAENYYTPTGTTVCYICAEGKLVNCEPL